MAKETLDYCVVLRGKGDGKGNHRGIMTIIPYANREAFEESQRNTDNSDEVVAQGISYEVAARICEGTSLVDRLAAAYKEASAVGEPSVKLLKYHIYMAIWGSMPEAIQAIPATTMI